MIPLTVHVVSKGRIIRATYSGGPYIELAFGGLLKPTEVINVWDAEAGRAEPHMMDGDRPSAKGVRIEVSEWITVNDEEWPEWYEGYLENAK
jgi:hypothetical protein